MKLTRVQNTHSGTFENFVVVVSDKDAAPPTTRLRAFEKRHGGAAPMTSRNSFDEKRNG
jgi:hypothetical protein